MVNIINKKYVTGNRMAYLALLSGAGSYRIESYPGAVTIIRQSWMRFIIATQDFDSWLERNSKFASENYGIKLGEIGERSFLLIL